MRTAALLLAAALAGPVAGQAAVQVLRGDAAARACRAADRMAAPAQPPAELLPGSHVATGSLDIAAAWLAAPTDRYGHAALGNHRHAGSLHARLRGGQEVVLTLPPDRVFEDRAPRLADLDGDGHDEVVVIESDAARGAALVVFGIEQGGGAPRWVERARGEPVGAMRWLNPVGVADFDGRAGLELASVTTPHVSGVLTLSRYAPPRLEVLGTSPGVSNHRYGSAEQRLSALLVQAGRPVAVVPAPDFRSLRLLEWTATGWREAGPPVPAEGGVRLVLPHGGDVCVALQPGGWLRLRGG